MHTIKGKNVSILHDNHPENLWELLLSLRNIPHNSIFDDTIHDPGLLPDIDWAIRRFEIALHNKERIMIFGDYDLDGISSTAALYLFLRDELGFSVSYRLPHRVKDGYGIKKYHMDEIQKTGTQLIVTVDCGTKDWEAIEYAAQLGLDVIVTDHHSCPDVLPQCIAVINPRRSDSLYPFSSLSGSGVVWKCIHALSRHFYPEKVSEILQKYVDIVALGTVADCMPMIDENRTIVRRGISQSQNSHHSFFQTLWAALSRPILNEDDIGFFIWPLLNAGGRLTTPYQSISTLLADRDTSEMHINGLIEVNQLRKNRSREAYEKALSTLDLSSHFLISIDEHLEHGILWLVAAKLTEQFHKPSAVFTLHEWKYVGSLRAPPGYDLVKILDASREFLDRYGGHAGAAGCTISFDHIVQACTSIQENTQKLYANQRHDPILVIDTVLDPAGITMDTVRDIDTLRPYGQEFKAPLFLLKPFSHTILPLGQTGEHIKWDSSLDLDVVWFHMSSYLSQFQNQKHFLIGTLTSHRWREKVTPQFQVLDVGFE